MAQRHDEPRRGFTLADDSAATKIGFCPMCGAPGKSRERRPDGNDTCEQGHVYASSAALKRPEDLKGPPAPPPPPEPPAIEAMRVRALANREAIDVRLRILEALRNMQFPTISAGALIDAAAELEEYVLDGKRPSAAPAST